MPVPLILPAVGAIAGKGKIKDLAQKALKSVVKLFSGHVSQDRFIDRYMEYKKILNNAGYSMPDRDHDKLITDLKIRKSQVKDKKYGNDTYAPEFERLRNYVIKRLEYNNPGLGGQFGNLWTDMIMVNKGNVGGEFGSDLKEVVTKYPPKSYKDGFVDSAIKPAWAFNEYGGSPDRSINPTLPEKLQVTPNSPEEKRESLNQLLNDNSMETDASTTFVTDDGSVKVITPFQAWLRDWDFKSSTAWIKVGIIVVTLGIAAYFIFRRKRRKKIVSNGNRNNR